MKSDFLENLARLCAYYDATFYYTKDDDGVHIALNGEDVFVGYLECSSKDNAEDLRAAKEIK